MWATPKTFSPSAALGPSETAACCCCLGALGAIFDFLRTDKINLATAISWYSRGVQQQVQIDRTAKSHKTPKNPADMNFAPCRVALMYGG